MPNRVSTVRHWSDQVLEHRHSRAPSACSFASRVRTPGFRSTVSYSWAITSRITS